MPASNLFLSIRNRFVSILLVIFIIWSSFALIAKYIDYKISINKDLITKRLSDLINYPIEIEKYSVKWHGFDFRISAKDIKVSEKLDKIPIIMADKISVDVDIFQYLRTKEVKINNVIADGLRVTLEKDKNGDISILSLSGESLGETVSYENFISIFEQYSEVTFNYADLHWQEENLDLPITQLNIKLSKQLTNYRMLIEGTIASDVPNYINLDLTYKGKLSDLKNGSYNVSFLGWGLDLNQWSKISNISQLKILSGKAKDLSVNFKYKNKLQSLDVKYSLENINADSEYFRESRNFGNLTGKMSWALGKNDNWHIKGNYKSSDLQKTQNSFDVKFNKNRYDFSLNLVDIADVVNIKQIYEYTDNYVTKGIINTAKGYYELNNKVGFVSLKINNIRTNFDKVFSNPIDLTSLKSDIDFSFDNEVLKLKTNKITVENNDTKLNGTFEGDIFKNNPPVISLEANIENISVGNFKKYLPQKIFKKDLNKWLLNSLNKGTIHTGTVKLSGDLANFPFDKNNGEYFWQLNFSDLDLNYSDKWPGIYDAIGKVIMNKDDLNIELFNAMILDFPISRTKGEIKGVTKKGISILNVDGKISSTLQAGLLFLLSSPLKDGVGQKLDRISPKGHVNLDLGLEIPLGDLESKVRGKARVVDGSIYLKDYKLALNNIDGDFDFTQNSVFAEDVNVNLFGKPGKVNISGIEESGKNKKNELKIAYAGFIEIKDIVANLIQGKKDYKKFVSGKSKYLIEVNLPFNENTNKKFKSTLNVASDLVGTTILLPEPLKKDPKEEKVLNLSYDLGSSTSQKLSFYIKDTVDGKLIFDFDSKGILKSGHIVLGKNQKSDWVSKSNLMIGGELDTLSWKSWLDFLDKNEKNEKNDFHLPIKIALLIKKFELASIDFKNTWIRFDYQDKKLDSDINFDGEMIKGNLQLPTFEDNFIGLNLDYLRVDGFKNEDKNKINYQNLIGKNPPVVIFTCKELWLNDSNYGHINFKVSPYSSGYKIDKLAIISQYLDLDAQGFWNYKQNPSTSRIDGTIKISKVGQALRQWGIKASLEDGDGFARFDGTWPGAPFDFSLENTKGVVDFEIKNGNIIGVNPGLGKIVGLLSIENIQRRLKLDFSDVVKDGFVFDKFKSKVFLENKIASSDNIVITGPSAKIELNGNTHLTNKTVDFQMSVTPQVGTGIPVAAAVATGNPAVGAAVWLFNKAIGSKISEITQYNYLVSGTWDAPIIKEAGSKSKKVRIRKSKRKND